MRTVLVKSSLHSYWEVAGDKRLLLMGDLLVKSSLHSYRIPAGVKEPCHEYSTGTVNSSSKSTGKQLLMKGVLW
jgi:hypothetical protein